jgi:Zn-dependent M28 family amino/carboxypeptidase
MRHLRAKMTSWLILVVLLYISATGNNVRGQTAEPESQQFSGEQALKYAAAQVEFGARPTGSDAWVKTGDYLIKVLKEAGWKVEEQPFDVKVDTKIIKARNIVATMGSGPSIIIGAHYDTRIYATNDPDQTKRMEPVMGANDAASGAAVLLELSQVIGKGYTFNREVRLVFFDAEDNGNIPGWPDWALGATYHASNLTDKPEYMVLLDMIGDKDLNVYYETNSLNSAPDIAHGIWETAAELGYADSFIASQKYNMIDDHIPFIEKGIPAVDLIDFDYPYWHTVSDTIDKISAESLEKVGRTMQTFLEKTKVIVADPNATTAAISATLASTP